MRTVTLGTVAGDRGVGDGVNDQQVVHPSTGQGIVKL